MRLPGVPAGRHFRVRPYGVVDVDKAGLALGVWLVLSPQLLGGVFAWGVIAIAAGAVFCSVVALRDGAKHGDGGPVTILGMAMLLSFALTVLQCLPMPCAAIRVLAPESAMRVEQAARALQQPSAAMCTLSQDPGQTREEVLKGAAILLSFFVAWMLCVRGARKTVLWSIASSTLAMALVGLAHALLGIDEVFGVYAPRQVTPLFLLAPLLNQNNLGGFLAMGVPIWIGLGRRERSPQLRALTYVATALLATCVMLTLSRAAIATLIAASIAMTIIVIARVRQTEARRLRWLFNMRAVVILASLAVGIGVGTLGGYGGGARVVTEFKQGGVDKLDLIWASLDVAWRHPWIGIGRGAFSSAFASLYGSTIRFEYAESFPVQWASEWGFPVTALLLASIVYALRVRLTRVASTQRAGAAVGLLMFAVHNLVDLGLEHVGVAVVASALLACVVAPSRTGPEHETLLPRPRTSSVLRAVALMTALVLMVLAPTLHADSPDELERALNASLAADARAEFRRTLERGLALHPSDPAFALLAAAEAVKHSDRSADRYLQLSAARSPGWPGTHALAAEWAFRNGQRERALAELRKAATIDETSVNRLLCPIMWRDPNLVFEAAPTNSQRFRYLEGASACLPPNMSAAESVDRAVLNEYPTAKGPRIRQAARLMSSDRADEALAQLDAALAGNRGDAELVHTRARLLLRLNRPAEAYTAAVQAEPLVRPEERTSLVKLRMEAATALKDASLVESTGAELRGLAGFDPVQLASAYAAEAHARRSLNQLGAALHGLEQAYRINSEPHYARSIAEIAETLGDRRRALVMYVKLCAENPADVDACAKRQALSGRQ